MTAQLTWDEWVLVRGSIPKTYHATYLNTSGNQTNQIAAPGVGKKIVVLSCTATPISLTTTISLGENGGSTFADMRVSNGGSTCFMTTVGLEYGVAALAANTGLDISQGTGGGATTGFTIDIIYVVI